MIILTLSILSIVIGAGGMIYIIVDEYKKHEPPVKAPPRINIYL